MSDLTQSAAPVKRSGVHSPPAHPPAETALVNGTTLQGTGTTDAETATGLDISLPERVPPAKMQVRGENFHAAGSPVGTTLDPLGLLIVDDKDAAHPARLGRSAFLAEAQRLVTAVADVELKAIGRSAVDCPYIAGAFAYYRQCPAPIINQAVTSFTGRKFRQREDLLEAIGNRTRQAVQSWISNGQLDAAPGVSAAHAAAFLRSVGQASGPAGDGAARALLQMGPGEALQTSTAQRFAPEVGPALAAVRLHLGPSGTAVARAAQAPAVAVGHDIAFETGFFRPGTIEGDALVAHELAHAAGNGVHDAQDAEAAADGVATHAVQRLWLGGAASPLPAGPRAARSILSLQRCSVSEDQERTPVNDTEMRRLGWDIRAPLGGVVGQDYRLELVSPGAQQPAYVAPGHVGPIAHWFVIRPDETEAAHRGQQISAVHTRTLDAEGTWTFVAAIYLPQNRVGFMEHRVVVRRPNVVAAEKLAAVKPVTVTEFLIKLGLQDVQNIRVGLADQRFAPAYIELHGENPAHVARAPNLPANVYTAHPAEGQSPVRYQWLAVPEDISGYPHKARFEKRRRFIDGRDGFDLGSGRQAGWTLSSETGVVQIYCQMFGADGTMLAEATYRQVVLADAEFKRVERFRTYMADVRSALSQLREPSVFVPAVHLATESGAVTELSFFLGRATESEELILVDLTPGVPRREYRAPDWEALLTTFAHGNSYPPGHIRLRVPSNPFDIAKQDWEVETSGASIATRLSTAWGWASLALAGLGALASVTAPPLAPVFFVASGVVGAASAAASLYQRSHESQQSPLGIAIDLAALAGSLIGAAGAANILRHGPRIAAATRTGQFVLYTGWATDLMGGVFMAVEGAAQIAEILDSPQSQDARVSAVVRILSGMLLNGSLLAWGARDLEATRGAIGGALGPEIAHGLQSHEIHALSLLDQSVLARLGTIEDTRAVAALIREDPVKAGRLIQLHGGSQFVQSARGHSGGLEALSEVLTLERRALVVGIAAGRLGQQIDEMSAKLLSRQMGVEVRIDKKFTGREILVEYRAGSWLSSADIGIRVGPKASIGDILLHQLVIDDLHNYRLLSNGFGGLYERAGAWLNNRRIPRSEELLAELNKHAAMQEARLQALNQLSFGPGLEQVLARDLHDIDAAVLRFRHELSALGAPEGVIGAWRESFSLRQLEQIFDAPGSGFERVRHSTSGNLISEPGYLEGRALDRGNKSKIRTANATYADVVGTDLSTKRLTAMELKLISAEDTVATHFRQAKISEWILEQHGGRIANLPAGTDYYLVIDLRLAGQTIPEALADLSTVLKNYSRIGDARRLWDGVRFITGSAKSPVLSGVHAIP